ncbi:MAG TPA: hypothetical protein VMC02_06365 [Steroidobacteraceae bacterium]|nr:hypothetical protein [Steroidobacteraceae bacterium]
MRRLIGAIALALLAHTAAAADLCVNNTYTLEQAIKGRHEYDSSCGLCHLYNLQGRVPGAARHEIPDIGLLDANYLKTLDGNGGMTPPLLSKAFFAKWKDQQAFSARISNAIGAFPPTNYVKIDSDARIAAYLLYRNCGKL